MENLNIVVKMKFGSHLYGTDTPESDLDFKGIFLPTREEVFLNRIPKSYSNCTKKGSDEKNTADDIDTEVYSLHYFLKLACEGQTVAMDMLHAPDDMVLESSLIWKDLQQQRNKFYTKNLKAFIGYARRQASKYGIKGSRLNAAQSVIELLSKHDPEERLSTVWGELPTGDHLHMVESTPQGVKQYQVCGKMIQETAKIGYFKEILERFYAEYGKRAQRAAENKGIDWKAISHAVRAAIQTKQILKHGDIVFPLKEAPLLLKIKQGKLDYTTEAAPLLETLMDEVESLSEQSELPAKVNRRYWDRWLMSVLDSHLT